MTKEQLKMREESEARNEQRRRDYCLSEEGRLDPECETTTYCLAPFKKNKKDNGPWCYPELQNQPTWMNEGSINAFIGRMLEGGWVCLGYEKTDDCCPSVKLSIKIGDVTTTITYSTILVGKGW